MITLLKTKGTTSPLTGNGLIDLAGDTKFLSGIKSFANRGGNTFGETRHNGENDVAPNAIMTGDGIRISRNKSKSLIPSLPG